LQFLNSRSQQGRFIIPAQPFIHPKLHGTGLKRYLDNAFGTREQTNFTFLNYKQQGKKETKDLKSFHDRCRALAHKVMRRDNEPTVKRIYEEHAERMLLDSFVGGLSGEIGKMTRIQNPQSLDQALNTALAVREAIRQEKVAETFYTKFEKCTEISERGEYNRSNGIHCSERTPKRPTDRKYEHNAGAENSTRSKRDTQRRADLKCYECEGHGHFAYECPTRLKKGRPRNTPGNSYPRGRSNRSGSPGDETNRSKGWRARK
jgi:hypothetical protein